MKKGTRILGMEANQITDKDFGKPKCVDGYVKEVHIMTAHKSSSVIVLNMMF